METPARSTSSVTIASGQSQSGIVECGTGSLVGIRIAAAWTSADLTFLHATDSAGTNWVPVRDSDGNEVRIPAANIVVDTYLSLSASMIVALFGLQRIKLRSGTSSAAVNQAADRTIYFRTRFI